MNLLLTKKNQSPYNKFPKNETEKNNINGIVAVVVDKYFD